VFEHLVILLVSCDSSRDFTDVSSDVAFFEAADLIMCFDWLESI